MNIHELTRQGKNICTQCNQPKTMYYQPWCPRCEPPVKETIQSINLIQCLKHLEHTKGMNYRDMWNIICNRLDVHNDSYTMYYPTEDMDDADEWTELKSMLNSTFNLTEPVLFHISW